jgi:hypothetical protein
LSDALPPLASHGLEVSRRYNIGFVNRSGNLGAPDLFAESDSTNPLKRVTFFLDSLHFAQVLVLDTPRVDAVGG